MTETENKAREVSENGVEISDGAGGEDDAAVAATAAVAASGTPSSSEEAAVVPDKLVLLKKYKETIVHLCNYQNEYSTRVDSLLESWKYIGQILQQSTPDASENLLHWVLKYTVRLILVGDWIKIEQEKRDAIKHKIESILSRLQAGSMSLYRCDYILKNIENPWGSEDLLNVLRGDPWIVTDNDMQFLTQERGCMILLRLQKLCEIKCDDMAFAWSSKSLAAYRAVNSEHVLRKSTSVKQLAFLFDVYLCHLHKYGHICKIIDEVKQLDLDSAQQLIHRNVNANAEIGRLTKYRKRVARLASDIVIAKLMVEELSDENEKYYCDILKEWLCIHKTVPVTEFRKNARKLYMTAISRKHLYLACDVIKQMEMDDWRELLLELCVRAITGDLNELELLKSEKSCDEHIVIQHEVDLSYRYIYLADLLKSHTPLAQECILTAFSLNPTKENYQLVRDIALRKQSKEHVTTNSNTLTSQTSSVAIPLCSNNQPVDDKQMERLTDQLSTDVRITKVLTSSPSSNVSSTNQSSPNQTRSNLTSTLEVVSITSTHIKPPIFRDVTSSDNVVVNNSNVAVPGPSKAHEHRTSIDVLHSITGSSKIFESPSYDALAAPSSIFDSLETMDLPDHIRSDLSVLLSNPRLKILSWMLPWPELDVHCQKLLKEDCKLSIVRQSLAGANDKLQYLHLDYNMFRHLPESECPGIEKGYEKYSLDAEELAALNNLALKRKKSRKSKKSSKERKEKPEKLTKLVKERPQKVVKKNIKSPIISSQPLQPAPAPQRTREYEALLRALYYQQLQHQLQLSQSLSLLNQHAPINRNFFLPYIAAQMQDRNRNDKQAISSPPPPPVPPLEKTTSKLSEIVKNSVAKPSSSTMPPPLQLQMPPPRTPNSKIQSEHTHLLLQQRAQPGQQMQARQQVHRVQSLQQPQQQASTVGVQKILSNVQQTGAQAPQNKPVMVQPVLIKDNNTLVKIAILQNITQKMLLQQQQQQQQQQMQQHVQKQTSSSATSAAGVAIAPRLMVHPPALQRTQSNLVLNPLNTFQYDPNIGIKRNIPTSTITSIQTSIARCNLPVETTVPAPMKMSSVIKPNAQISIQPNSGKNIYSCSSLGTVATVVKIAQTKPTVSKATIAKTASKPTTVKVIKVKPLTKSGSAPMKASGIPIKTMLSQSAKSSTTKSKVVKATPVKIKVNPAGITLLPADSFAGVFRKFEGHSESAPPLSPIILVPQQKSTLPLRDSSSTESAPESLKYNVALYDNSTKKASKKSLQSPKAPVSLQAPKLPKKTKTTKDLNFLKEPKACKEPKKSKEPKPPKESKARKVLKTPKPPKILKESKTSKTKTQKLPKVPSNPSIQRSRKNKTPKTSKLEKSIEVGPSTSINNETISNFLNFNVQQDISGPSGIAVEPIIKTSQEPETAPIAGIALQNSTITPLENTTRKSSPQPQLIQEMAGDILEQVPISASREIEQYIIKIREGLVDDSTKDVSTQDEENNDIIDMLLDMEEHKELTESVASPQVENVGNLQSPPPTVVNLETTEDSHTAEVVAFLEPIPEVARTVTVETTLEQPSEPSPEPAKEPTKIVSPLLVPETAENKNSVISAMEEPIRPSSPTEKEACETSVLNKESPVRDNDLPEDDLTAKSDQILPEDGNMTSSNWSNHEDLPDHINSDTNSPIPPVLQDDYDVFERIPGILNTSFRNGDVDADGEGEKVGNGLDYPSYVRPEDINPSIDLPAEERCSQVMHTIFQRQPNAPAEPNAEIAQIFSNSIQRQKRDPRIYLRRVQPSDFLETPEDTEEEPVNSSFEVPELSKSNVHDVEEEHNSRVNTPVDNSAGEVNIVSSSIDINGDRTKNVSKRSVSRRPTYGNYTENEGSDLEVEAILSTKVSVGDGSTRSIRPKTAMLRAYYATKPPPTPKRPKSSAPGRPRGRPPKAKTLPKALPKSLPKSIHKPLPLKRDCVITLSSESESDLTLNQMKNNGLQKQRNLVRRRSRKCSPSVKKQQEEEKTTKKTITDKERRPRSIKRSNDVKPDRRRRSVRRDDSDDSYRPYRPSSRPGRRKSAARSAGYRSDNDIRRRSRSGTPYPRCKSVMHGRTSKRSNSRKRNMQESNSWLGHNVPMISPRRRSGRYSGIDSGSEGSFSASTNTEIELLTSVGEGKRGFSRLRRTSTLNVSYYDHDSDSDSVEEPQFRPRSAKRVKRVATPHHSKNLNLPKGALNDPKLFLQTPIVELTRCSNSQHKNSHSPLTSDSEGLRDSKSSMQPKRIKKIYLKNIRSSKIAIVNESSCSSPRTEPEILDLNESKKGAITSKGAATIKSVIALKSAVASKGVKSVLAKKVDPRPSSVFSRISEKNRHSQNNEPRPSSVFSRISEKNRQHQTTKPRPFSTFHRISEKNHQRGFARRSDGELLGSEKPKKRPVLPERAVSMPPSVVPVKPAPKRNEAQVPEIRLKKLDNLTMLKYRQNILVNGILVASPTIALKRLKIKGLPVRLSSQELQEESVRRVKVLGVHKMRKNFPTHLQQTIREELDSWGLQTTRYKPYNRSINLMAEAEIPTNKWNNLDMFQVSSDEDSLMELSELRRPPKIPRIDNKLTKNCNVTKGTMNKDCQSSPRDLASNLGSKKNFMFDIYSVVVKPDFMESPPSSLFSCNMKKENISKTVPTASSTMDASDLFLSIAAKFLIKSLSVTEEKQYLVHEMISNKKDCWLPDVLGRRILEQEITEILFGVRSVLKDTISSIVPNKSFRLVNETLDDSKREYYLSKKLMNALPSPQKEIHNKWPNGVELPAYNELRKFIYPRTLGKKFNNTIGEYDNLLSKSEENKEQNRILFEVPGFRSLEYFTAPSYHCLPVVRIVHSTIPLDEKTESEPSSSETSNEVPKNSTTGQNVSSIGGGQKATLVPIVHKTFGAPIECNQAESGSGNVRVIIPQVTGSKKGTPAIHNNAAIKTTATLIKVDKKDVSDRITKMEPNFVLLGCGNSNKFVPIKKDDRILLTTSATGGISDGGADRDNPRSNIQQCRLLETSTLKTVPKVSLGSGSSNATTTILPVQFIYKSDGGMIHFTPVSSVSALQNLNIGKEVKTISLVKAETKTGTAIESGTSSHLSVINTRSLYEENYAKFIQTSSASQENTTAVIQAFVQQSSSHSCEHSMVNASLPKFTQAFGGKSVYIEGSDEGAGLEIISPKKDQNKTTSTTGNFLLAKQNVTISRPIICSVAESLTKKTTSIVPSARIVSGAKQQLKVIQSADRSATTIGQRTTLLNPLPISVPIVSQAAISNYVQTRYMRPFFHISQGNLQAGSLQGGQQVLITTSHGTAATAVTTSRTVATTTTNSNSLSSPATTVATKIKCLPALTVTKREKSKEEKKKPHIEGHVDNSTLEQLREFDLVLEQVKERSTTSSTAVVLPLDTPAMNVEKSTDAMSQTDVSQSCTVSISEEESISASIPSPGSSMMNFKLLQKSPIVVVANNLANSRLFTSPAKATCVEKTRLLETTPTKQIMASSSTLTKCGVLPPAKIKSTQKAMASPVLSPTVTYTQKIAKPQEDEQTVQRIYDILAEYAEQLRNSPDLNNKPAPRRRSNPLNSCSSNGKKRKTLIQKPSDNSIASTDLDHTMDSEDSSCETSSLYNRSPLHDSSTSIDSSNHFLGRQQQSAPVKSETDCSTIGDASTKGTNTTALIAANQNQSNRTTTTTTAVLVPGKYIFPLNTIKGTDGLDTNTKKTSTTSTQQQVVYKTRPIKPADALTPQKGTFKPISVQNVRQPLAGFSQRGVEHCASSKSDFGTSSAGSSKPAIVFHTQPPTSADFTNTIQRNNIKVISVQQQSTAIVGYDPQANVHETSVITKAESLAKNPSHHLQLPLSSMMLSKMQQQQQQQQSESMKRPTSDKIRNNLRLDSCRSTSSKILKQLNEGRKLALEREMKFQKSLSDECEDLGVDELSTSDLFPEADLLFDPTSSSFENNSQDEVTPKDVKAFPKTAGINGTSHTSGESQKSPPPWSPAEDPFNAGFKSDAESAEDVEEEETASSECDGHRNKKIRLSGRWTPVKKANNCLCYAPSVNTTAPAPTVLNSSTQTLTTTINYLKDKVPSSSKSSRLLSPSQIVEHLSGTKRIRSLKVSTGLAETATLKLHRYPKSGESSKESSATIAIVSHTSQQQQKQQQEQHQAVLTLPAKRTMTNSRFAKINRR